MRHSRISLAALVFLSLTAVSHSAVSQDQAAPWKAPSRASRKKNPLPDDAAVIAQGKAVFESQCISCHGATGVGDGVAAKDLEKHPGDLTSAVVQSQSDGSIFWKITTGRAPMTAFGDTLSVEERWQVVRYVRTLIGGPTITGPELEAPEPLRASLAGLQQPYDELRHSLAKGDSKAAIAALPALTAAIGGLTQVDTTGLSKTLGESWKQAEAALSKAASAMNETSKLEDARIAFGGLSAALEAALARFGHTLPAPLFVFECAEASHSGALRWLQTTRDPDNPYRGSQATSCVKTIRGIAATQQQANPSGDSK